MLTAGAHSIALSKGFDLGGLMPNQEDFARRTATAKEHGHVMGMLGGEEEEL